MRAGERRDFLRIVVHEDRVPQVAFGGLLVELEHQLPSPPARLELDLGVTSPLLECLAGRAHAHVVPGRLAHELGHRRPPPRWREVQRASLVDDGGRAEHVEREARDELLDERHDVAVVGVGLVELERGELGIVARRQALVAEQPADLEHLLEAADHEPLQVELGGDAQVHVHVEGAEVGDEGSRVRTAWDGVEDRRLDLDEPEVPQPFTHAADEPAAKQERVPALRVRPQVDLALAETGLHVGHAPPLVAETATRLGEHHPVRDLDRELAAASPHHLAACTDPVAEMELREGVEVASHPVRGEQLHRSRGVSELGEGELALGARKHHPPGDGHLVARLLPRGEAAPALDDLRRRRGLLEPVRDCRHAPRTAVPALRS